MTDYVDTSTGKSLTGLAAWKKQLITKEDPMHVHKTLGIACLVSFCFRLVQLGPSDMGFARFPHFTIPTIALHLLLNVSALVFHIPQRRISSGYRIWPEYRLHSLVFLSRSLAVMLLYWYEQTYQNGVPNYDWNLRIVLLGMVAADLSSYSQRAYASSTIRDLDTAPWVKFLFSVAQFCGTANILYGLRHRYAMHMLSCIVIQGNAFLMTVRRKNLASHTFLVSLYGLALLVSLVVCVYEYTRVHDTRVFCTVASIAHVTVVQRMAPWPHPTVRRIVGNKYVVWLTAGLVLRQLRPWLTERENDTGATSLQVGCIFAVTFVALWTLGWYQCYGPGAAARATKPVPKAV